MMDWNKYPHYLIYDGRAQMSVDDAEVLESCRPGDDVKQAVKNWADADGVLFGIDDSGEQHYLGGCESILLLEAIK